MRSNFHEKNFFQGFILSYLSPNNNVFILIYFIYLILNASCVKRLEKYPSNNNSRI